MTPDPPPELLQRLARHHQERVLVGWDGLAADELESIIAQLAGIDLAELLTLYRRKDEPHTLLPPRDRIAPLPPTPSAATAAERAHGEEALRRGEVAALLVAGGQGSRLGFDKPKGMYPVGPVSGASLFQVHAEKVLALSGQYGKPVPLLVMTSPATHDDTEAYFREHRHFGLSAKDVFFFQQGTMPSLDFATGKLLLEKRGRVFLSPNGHGGTLTALSESGLLADMKARGIRHVFYFQVDNPLVKIGDPDFLGRHVAAESEVSSKFVVKEDPAEKAGVLAVIDGKCGIIEYSDMPAEMAAEREPDGTLRFRAGSPAIHIFAVSFLERVAAEGGLKYHIAKKKVPYFDPATGQTIEPKTENALKFEMFIFDVLPMARRWLAVETPRAEEFAPLKNATGADSPETVRRALLNLYGGWLEKTGVKTNGHPVEVSPLFALDAAELAAKLPKGFRIEGPTHMT
jgi:UDP-N-acetylglucosamine/UDP-N-acetylgalactosamine diphosphorylase